MRLSEKRNLCRGPRPQMRAVVSYPAFERCKKEMETQHRPSSCVRCTRNAPKIRENRQGHLASLSAGKLPGEGGAGERARVSLISPSPSSKAAMATPASSSSTTTETSSHRRPPPPLAHSLDGSRWTRTWTRAWSTAAQTNHQFRQHARFRLVV